MASGELEPIFAPMTLEVWHAIGTKWQMNGIEAPQDGFMEVGDVISHLYAPAEGPLGEALNASHLLIRRTRRVSHRQAILERRDDFLSVVAFHLANGAKYAGEAEELATYAMEFALLDKEAAAVWSFLNDCVGGEHWVVLLDLIDKGRGIA
jgi:hypothetical protein